MLHRTDVACDHAHSSAPAIGGSRRRRLWDLGGHSHCSVIGVCLPLATLRRLARKTLGSEPADDDYELHCTMVSECRQRSPMAEAMQRELDRRFLLPLRRAATAKTAEALAAWWQDQGESQDLPGALWATLTHARCTPALEHQVLSQVHMLQHQVGMATRVELARFEALIDENAVLARELAASQQRSTRQAAAHAEQVAALQAELIQLRGERMAAETGQALLREELAALQALVPELESRLELSARAAQLAERVTDLQRSLQAARTEIERLSAQAAPDAATLAPTPQPHALPAPPALDNRSVLCVGGRTASIPVYRRLVEACGGRFLHHDGGEEHHLLGPLLAAADLVICQTGCVSHNAYWRVKDHCKRSGKRCVFVEAPSAAAMQRALAVIADPA